MTAPVDVTPSPDGPALRRRRWLALVVGLVGIALVATWATTLGRAHGRSDSLSVSAAQRTPVFGSPVPAGQQRYAAGESGHLADGASITVFGPVVGVPPGTAAKEPASYLVPIAFTVRVTAGSAPVTVSPADFVVTMPGMPTQVGTAFGGHDAAPTGTTPSLSAAPFTVQPGQTAQYALPTHSIAQTGQIAYAPHGVTQVAWVFSTEDD